MVEPSRPDVRRCLKCGWLFVSQDRLRLRRCQDCKSAEDGYSPRTGKVTDHRELARGDHDFH